MIYCNKKETKLYGFSGIKMAKKQVIAYLHTHWDREWYRTKEEFNLRLLEVFDEILYELETGSAPYFYFDGQTCALEDYLKFRPEKLKSVKTLIEKGKLDIGPFFVSPDNFLVNGISLIRNLDLGVKYSKNFGSKRFLGYLADTFGHSKSIFKILKSFNIPYALAWRGISALEHNDFKMNGINTTKLVYGYFMDALHSLCNKDLEDITKEEWQKTADNLENILDRIVKNSSNKVLLPVGADHLAVLKNSSAIVKNVNKYLKNYEIKLSTPFEYVENADYTKLSMDGELLDNSETYILPGVYSSRIPQKVDNAKLQWELFRIVEPFNYFMEKEFKNGGNYTSSLDYAVKTLIKNHAHDSIYGCSIDEVHKCVQSRFDKVKAVADGIKYRLMRDFKRLYLENTDTIKISAASKNLTGENSRLKIGVFNFSNYEYSGVVKLITDFKMQNAQLVRKFKAFSDEILYDTRQIPVTEQYLPFYEYLVEAKSLPPFSFNQIENVKTVSSLEITENKISNSLLELNLTRKNNKFTVNFLDKRNGKKYNDVLKILDTKDVGDSYNSAPVGKPVEFKLLGSKIIEKGPVRATLRLLFEHNFKLDISLANTGTFFEFEAKFNNNKKNRKIQACLKLQNPIDTTIAEDAAGFIQRKHDYNWLLSANVPAKPKIEVKTNSYPMQRWLIAQDLGVLTLGLNDYEIYKNELKITLIRGTGRISEPKNPARFIPAGPPIETPDLQCQGFHTLNFAVVLNPDIASIQRDTEVFYQPTVGILGNFNLPRSKKLLNLPENLIFCGLKPNDGKTFGVFYNSSDKNIIYKNKTVEPDSIDFIEL